MLITCKDPIGVVGRDDGEEGAVGSEAKFIDADLAVEAVNRMGIVVSMIDDVVVSVFLDDAMMARPVDGAVGISFQDAALIFVRPHRSCLRYGILHTISMVVTRTRRIGEVIRIATLEHKGCFEDILQFRIRNQPLLRKELIGCYREWRILFPVPRIAPFN